MINTHLGTSLPHLGIESHRQMAQRTSPERNDSGKDSLSTDVAEVRGDPVQVPSPQGSQHRPKQPQRQNHAGVV